MLKFQRTSVNTQANYMPRTALGWFYSTVKLFKNWPEIYRDKLQKKETREVFLRNGFSISMSKRDAVLPIVDEIFREKVYGDLSMLKGAPIIIDIGAHIGIFVLYVKSQIPQAKMYCFEPSIENNIFLKKNIENNKLKDCYISNNGLAGQEGSRILHIDGSSSGKNSLFGEKGQLQQIEVTTLPKILSKIGPVDFVKIDIEGAEVEVMDSLSERDFSLIKTIAIECKPNYKEKLQQKLEKFGFKEISYIHSAALFTKK